MDVPQSVCKILNLIFGWKILRLKKKQDQKFDKTGGILSGDITPSRSGTLTLGTAAFPFKSGFFADLTVSNNTLYVGEKAITATDTGGLDFESATSL